MLVSLSIENIAVIEKAEIEFENGFNALTGETGAGKALLIDSLSMGRGMRTARELIRGGAAFALVTALFMPSPDLSDLGIEPEEDGGLLLQRRISADGRSVCKINGVPTPLSTLRAVGERLVSIYGQHDGTALLKSASHLPLLDEFAKSGALLDEYRAKFAAYKKAKKELDELSMSESERAQRKDALSFRIEEVSGAALVSGEGEALAEKRDTLRNFAAVSAALDTAHEALSATGGAKDALYCAMKAIDGAAAHDKSLASISEALNDLYYNAEDVAMQLSSIISETVFSPAELDEIEERLDVIARLKKKYNADIDTLLAQLEEWQNEFDTLDQYEENAAKIEKHVEELRAEMIEAGEKLEQCREEGAKKLSDAVCAELSFLDMPKAKFAVSFEEHEPSASGLRGAEFMLATNPAEGLKPLSKIASGGELSRIMLALRSALAVDDGVGTLIFDEIDAGVSGHAAVKIAEKLSNLAEARQIICITHLPQIAAVAGAQFLVSKDTSSDVFRAKVSRLDRDGRIDELSRLISGDAQSGASRAAAEELLNRKN